MSRKEAKRRSIREIYAHTLEAAKIQAANKLNSMIK